MAYEHYKVWLRGLPNPELNEELKKVLKKVREAKTELTKNAWSRMYDAGVAEMHRRDHK